MKIKVCGMKYPDNISDLCKLPIDWMGLIFYPPSPRYVNELDPQSLKMLPSGIKKTGVFVNATTENILSHAKRFDLHALQLHGSESPELCRLLKEQGYLILKTFSLENESDLAAIFNYESFCDYFLFDTKTRNFGGSGRQFDWAILQNYKGNTPFFLSGGIGPEHTSIIQKIDHPLFYGIDLNSRFESEPGRKNIELLNEFIIKL